jgi:hypothetical protein
MDLADGLTKQIEFKLNDQNSKKQEQEYIEKMEQLKLAEKYLSKQLFILYIF